MTIAIVHHRATLSDHAVLLVDTTAGTLLLDSVTDEILLWHAAPCNFALRRRQDGQWKWCDQCLWRFEPPLEQKEARE